MYTFMTALCKHWCWRQTWFSSDCGKEQEAAIEDFMRKLFHGLFTSQRVVCTPTGGVHTSLCDAMCNMDRTKLHWL